ncbi:enoyl-CoA hydratase-related protein, partial [Mycobacterium kansasii]
GRLLGGDDDVGVCDQMQASFTDPHVSIGQAVAYEAITLLRKSPMEAVLRMTLSGKGERISAQRAYQLGIVSEVVPADQLRAAAGRLAAAIATNSP